MSGLLRRIAVAGTATRWPTGPAEEAWNRVVVRALEDEVAKMPSGSTLVLRNGDADRGPDAVCTGWARMVIATLETKGARLPDIAPGVTVRLELVPADWDNCVTAPGVDARGVQVKPCPAEVGGRPHRKPSKRSKAADGCICPSAGHRRNPDVVTHPGFPVHALHAWCINDSPGTEATIRAARKARIPTFPRYYYL